MSENLLSSTVNLLAMAIVLFVYMIYRELTKKVTSPCIIKMPMSLWR